MQKHPSAPLQGVENIARENSLREAFLGPSLVAMAIGSVVARPSDEIEDNKFSRQIPHFKRALFPAPTSAFLARAWSSQQSYPSGATVTLFLEVENISGAPATLVFGGEQEFDFEACSPTQSWKWSDGRIFFPKLRSQTMRKGEILRFECEFPTHGLPPEKFQICARCMGNGGIIAPAFEIELV